MIPILFNCTQNNSSPLNSQSNNNKISLDQNMSKIQIYFLIKIVLSKVHFEIISFLQRTFQDYYQISELLLSKINSVTIDNEKYFIKTIALTSYLHKNPIKIITKFSSLIDLTQYLPKIILEITEYIIF